MNTPAVPAVSVRNLSKSFKAGDATVSVIKNLSFRLEKGSFEAIMGASGSGKSTFLHLLAGLLPADSGSVEMEGRNLVALSDQEATLFRRRHIGLVFQDFNLIPTLTARENIELPLLLDRKKADSRQLETLAETLGISPRLNHLPEQLSGGERQRVAIARALITRPAVLLADEPTGNLDSPAARELCTLLQTLNRETGCAILLVTHDPVIAAAATRVHLLRDGAFTDCFETGGDAAIVSRHYVNM